MICKTDLVGSPSKAAKSSPCSERQAAKSLFTDKSAPAGDSLEPNTRKDALEAKVATRLSGISIPTSKA
jgi:hypothetical protein